MGSLFENLPPEMVQKCVEFLPFAEVHAEIKQVSKATRKVARRALTRGRWKPFRYVAQQALAAVSEIDHRAFFREPDLAEDPNLVAYEITPGVPISFERFLGRRLQHDESGPLVGRGLGAWSDPKLAAVFTRHYLLHYGHGNDIEMHDTTARAWSDDWEDRTKANAFIAEIARIWNEMLSLGTPTISL